MERYSEGSKELNDVEVFNNCSYSCYSNLADAIQILEAYEDTGLTPEEIKNLVIINGNLVKANDKLNQRHKRDMENMKELDEALREYQDC